MASYNRVIIMGNLTRDPEYKQLSSGQAVCRLGVASNRQFKNRQSGQVVQEVCFVDVDVWGAQADSCQQYLQKGRAVLIEGRLKLDTWQDNEGQRRSKHSIVADRVTFLPSASSINDENQLGSVDQNGSNGSSQKEEPKTESVASPKPETVQAPAEEKTSSTNTGEVDFKDQKPFEDDLPF